MLNVGILMSNTFSILLLLFGTLLDAHAHANLIISNVCGFFVGVYLQYKLNLFCTVNVSIYINVIRTCIGLYWYKSIHTL